MTELERQDAPDDAPPSGPVEYRDEPGYVAIYLTVMVLLAALFSLAASPIGVAITAVFALSAAWAGLRLLRPKVRVQITEEGIVDENFWYSPGLIPWDNVLDIQKGPWATITVDLRDEAAFFDGLDPLQVIPRVKWRLLGFGPATISALILDASHDEVVDELQAGLDAYTLRSGASSPAIPEGGGKRLPGSHDDPAE